MVQTIGRQRILRTDAFIINTSVLERSCSLDTLQNIPFNSLSSAFPYLSPPMLHKANLLSDSSSTTVCWGRCDWEGFSNENKEGKNDGGSKEGESDRLLRLRSLTDPPVCVAVVVVMVRADFDGSQVVGGMDLISQTTALWEGRKRERVCVF